jgi:hypothetical protein
MAMDAYRQAQSDVEVRAPRDVREAAGSFGNLVISFTNDPENFGEQMIQARRQLDQLVRRELGTDETI